MTLGLPIISILPHLDALEPKGSTRSMLTTLFSLPSRSQIARGIGSMGALGAGAHVKFLSWILYTFQVAFI